MTNTESAILGLMFRYQGLFPLLSANLQADDFGENGHRPIYRAMRELYQDNQPITVPSVRDKLGPDGPGMRTYLSLMENAALVPADGAESVLLNHISQLKKDHGQRAMLSMVSQIVAKPEITDADIENMTGITERMKTHGIEREASDVHEIAAEYAAQLLKPDTGITLGIPTFDFLIDGFQFGELITIMSRAAVGKTFLALNVLDHLAKANQGRYVFGFFSLEMPQTAVLERLFQLYFNLGRIDVRHAVGRGTLELGDFWVHYGHVRIYEKIYSVPEIAAIIEREDLRVVFIDFLHLLRSMEVKTEYQRVTGLMRELKQLAKDEQIVCFNLHQLSRQGGGGWEPVRIDMARDSGAVEELSDFVIGAHCIGLHPEHQETHRNEITLTLLKNKRGPRAILNCFYDPNSRRIREIDKAEKPL